MYAPHTSINCLIASPEWKKMQRKTRWAFLGKWDQSEESVYQEVLESDKSAKPHINYLKTNVKARKVVDDREGLKRRRKESRSKARQDRQEVETLEVA